MMGKYFRLATARWAMSEAFIRERIGLDQYVKANRLIKQYPTAALVYLARVEAERLAGR